MSVELLKCSDQRVMIALDLPQGLSSRAKSSVHQASTRRSVSPRAHVGGMQKRPVERRRRRTQNTVSYGDEAPRQGDSPEQTICLGSEGKRIGSWQRTRMAKMMQRCLNTLHSTGLSHTPYSPCKLSERLLLLLILMKSCLEASTKGL